jgi:sugar/nucleoside kinase (ribokinase family)
VALERYSPVPDREPPRTVVVIGDALIDEIHVEGSVRDFVGGAALNVAVGLSALGVRTTLIAMVGNDADGATIRAFLEEYDVALIPTIGPFGSSRGVSDRTNAEPTYVFNAAAQVRRIELGVVEKAAIEAATLVVVSCFPFDDVQQSDELMAAISEPEARLIIDPNPRASMMHDARRFVDTMERFVPKTLLVKVGDDDARLLAGSTIDEFSRHLLSVGAPAVLSTAGPDGARVFSAGGLEASVPIATMPGRIVDTMGAGDATLASVVASILADGYPNSASQWHAMLARAMLVAAATCRNEGALLRLP